MLPATANDVSMRDTVTAHSGTVIQSFELLNISGIGLRHAFQETSNKFVAMQADRYRFVPCVFDICREFAIRGARNAGSSDIAARVRDDARLARCNLDLTLDP